jgi:hypothetical protein
MRIKNAGAAPARPLLRPKRVHDGQIMARTIERIGIAVCIPY